MLEIRDLHVQFHEADHEAVRGIDLTVGDGEIVVVQPGDTRARPWLPHPARLPRRAHPAGRYVPAHGAY